MECLGPGSARKLLSLSILVDDVNNYVPLLQRSQAAPMRPLWTMLGSLWAAFGDTKELSFDQCKRIEDDRSCVEVCITM